MALNLSDVIMISRAGTKYKISGTDILNMIQANVGTGEYEAADIAARNALSNLTLGDRIMVIDATGDATVSSGWAIYVYRSPGVFTKMAEQEGLDVVVGAANLSYTPGASSGIVVSSTGTDATIPAANGTEAGLLLPAEKAKLTNIGVTQPVDLDAMESASHAAVSLAGSASTNPLTLAGQTLDINIANLTTAP